MTYINIEESEQTFIRDAILEPVFFICVGEGRNDEQVADEFGIPYENYIEILKKYGAIQSEVDREYYFKTLKKAIKCLHCRELEPYVIMLKLIN